MWQVDVLAPKATVELITSFLEDNGCEALSWSEDEQGGWLDEKDELGFPVAAFFQIMGFYREQPDVSDLHTNLAKFLKPHGHLAPQLNITPVDLEQDWQITWPPQTVGKLWIAPEDSQDTPPPAMTPIYLSPAMAFGSGEHPTTQGCLVALQDLPYSITTPLIIADIGCGSGILSIAAAKLWPNSSIYGNDIEEVAVLTSIRNAKHNHVDARCHFFQECGTAQHQHQSPYDIIVANILADPLSDLAPDIAQLVAPNAYVILSGFLTAQLPELENTYQHVQLNRHQLYVRNDWCTLVLKKT